MNEDPYVWMEDLNNPKVKGFIETKNRVFKERFDELSRKLYPRVLEIYENPVLLLIRCTKTGLFSLHRLKDRYIIRHVGKEAVKVIVDSKNLGGETVIQWFKPSVDGRLLAFFYSRGSDVGVLEIIDTETLEKLDRLEGSVGDITWIDRDRYYYSRFYRDDKTPDGVNAPAERVFMRSIDGREEMVFGFGLETQKMISVHESLISDKVFVNIHLGWVRNWIYAGSKNDPSSWRLIYDPGETVAYPIEYVDGEYLIVVYDGEGLGRVISVNEGGCVKELVKEDPKYPLEEAVYYNGNLVLSYLVDASHRLRIVNPTRGLLKEVSFEKPGSVLQLQSCPDRCVFIYRSFATPYRVYEIRGEEVSIIEDRSFNNVCVEEHFVESFDKTPVHVFHVHKCGVRGDKAVLTGYGGFGLSLTPRFLDYMLVFIEDGGEYFVANIRGGGEYGRRWHEAGRRELRENVYSDFLSVVKWLKERGYKVVITGRSNGGLLCGVIFTRHPDYIDGAAIGYPLLDMLRFHKLYIGKLWVTEYGDPDNPRDRDHLLRISPYHNVKRGVKYPAPLVYTGLNDDRVHPAHALKFSAKLDECGVENYLRVETASGHVGADPSVVAKEASDILAYIYTVLGLDPRENVVDRRVNGG